MNVEAQEKGQKLNKQDQWVSAMVDALNAEDQGGPYKMGSDYIGPVWCCEHRYKCKWQAFALYQGLAWGTILPETNEWRKWHDKECGGRLIQLIEKEDLKDGV